MQDRWFTSIHLLDAYKIYSTTGVLQLAMYHADVIVGPLIEDQTQ